MEITETTDQLLERAINYISEALQAKELSNLWKRRVKALNSVPELKDSPAFNLAYENIMGLISPKKSPTLCKSCGKEIFYLKLKSLKFNPVLPEKIYLNDENGDKKVFTITGEMKSLKDCQSGYLSHYVDCPQSKDWKK